MGERDNEDKNKEEVAPSSSMTVKSPILSVIFPVVDLSKTHKQGLVMLTGLNLVLTFTVLFWALGKSAKLLNACGLFGAGIVACLVVLMTAARIAVLMDREP